ncbi:MAG: RluA family pseudouridine synthase [Sphingomonadaceae bacterium]|nr:RluA family pseudouridine synthase [Sphingomonadaceae bacterium]
MGPGESNLSVELPADAAGWRLDRALAAAVPQLSRERLKALVSAGAVRGRDGTLVRDPALKVRGGEAFWLELPPVAPPAARAEAIPLVVPYEDEHLLILDKPAGLVVHPACGHADGTLVNALLHHCAGRLSGIGGVARPGIVHRIDKDTSGLMVVAKTDPAHEGLARQFAAHTIDRRYLAVTSGRPVPAAGRIEGAIGRSPQNRQKMAIVDRAHGKHAVTHYAIKRAFNDAALVECRLETGRTHQVRVHMASIGHALLGDPVYGRPSREHRSLLARLDFHRQALHAARLGFRHPISGVQLGFESDLPQDMAELIDSLSVEN